MNPARTSVLAAILLLTVPAYAAQPTGLYLGPEVAATKLNFDGVDYSKTRMTLGGLVGWQFNPIVGVELGYYGGGKVSESTTVDGTAVDVDVKYSAVMAAVVGQYEFNDRYSVFARFGAYIADQDSVVSTGTNTWIDTSSASRAIYGIGFGVRIDRVRSRLEYRRTSFAFANSGEISLSLAWFVSSNR